MKRNDFITKVLKHKDNTVFTNKEQVEAVLEVFEKLGMKPPSLDKERCQVLMHIYYAGYTFNQWDEQFDKDQKLVDAYTKRMESLKCKSK